ncbi:cytochrome b [Shewanella surugensis]|uniref:Cytochrome b n=1 Tax=Shewanella surugensis TaxID=212020 RepID=A0ABT0L6D4_9GAMM|nr:cytochrome b [Shewanella surugensis]MCL1123045.1 cytochrome b [Shewanella surugensis]
MFRNTSDGYGIVSIAVHWISALTVFGIFFLGFWMVDLTYYSTWYKTAPHIHKSVGILLLLLTVFRFAWRLANPKPRASIEHQQWEKKVSHYTHMIIYLLLFAIMSSGYLISTADDRGIWVFDWFELPSLGQLFTDQADIAGLIHQVLAYSLIGLAILHSLGALKHHFLDKDNTLIRMFKIASK